MLPDEAVDKLDAMARAVKAAKYKLRYLKNKPDMLSGTAKDRDEAKAPLWTILPCLATQHQVPHLMSAFKASDLKDVADEPHPTTGLSTLQKAGLHGGLQDHLVLAGGGP